VLTSIGKKQTVAANEHLAFDPKTNPNQDQRCERDLRQGLDGDDVRVNDKFQQANLADQGANDKGHDRRERKSQDDLLHCGEKAIDELPAAKPFYQSNQNL
jgi:hypothetical protein